MSRVLYQQIQTQVYRSSTFIRATYSTSASKPNNINLSNWNSDECQYLQQSKIPTMYFQKSLLRLPIPELEKTCSRYLLAQKVLLSPEEYTETEKAVKDFQTKSGPPLQEKLKAIDKSNKHTSYISQDWFDMYLSDRASLVLNYNPFLAFLPPEPPYTDPVLRAANILTSSARFLKSLRSSILEPEVFHLNPNKSDTQLFRKLVGWTPEMFASYVAYAQKAFPLDMSQFGHLFNSTRIPQVGIDTFSKDPNARHVLVMKNGNFFVFDILDEQGHIYPPSHLLACLKYIYSDTTPKPQHPLGYLTSENRDTWAKVRSELQAAGNADSLRTLDHSAFNLVFDDTEIGMDAELAYRTFLYGDGGNRWFDKCFSLLIAKDGMTALNFEHGWGDGVAVMRYFNEVQKDCQENSFVTTDTPTTNIDPSKYVKKLEWHITPSIEAAVSAAKAQYEASTSALDVHYYETEAMNRVSCKKHKVSPDAIMQLGFQVAYAMLHGGVVSTYESCSTSAFKHGRTETLRPATLQTKAFSEAVLAGNKSNSELKQMIKDCSTVHAELTKQAAMGQGFDRHLFGLRKVSERAGLPLPLLYQDPAFERINYHIISTSTLPSNYISLGGFAPVVRDGFGVGYQISDERLGLIVSTYPPHRDSKAFVECATKAYTIIRSALDGQ